MTMREILFRGKRADNGEWTTGTPFFVKGRCKMIHAVAVHPDFLGEGNVYYSEGYQVIPDTVGQFTGLTDKNGKKIFEGDIVERWYTLTRGPHKETRERQVGVVQYDSITCGYLLRGACNLRRQWPGDTIEVIGNIHDNPELMEDECHG